MAQKLNEYHEHLQERVERRTAELTTTNAQLHRKTFERTRAEDALRHTKDAAWQPNSVQRPLKSFGGRHSCQKHVFPEATPNQSLWHDHPCTGKISRTRTGGPQSDRAQCDPRPLRPDGREEAGLDETAPHLDPGAVDDDAKDGDERRN